MKRELIVQRSPKSPVAEVFRTLRTNIQFMNSQKDLKTLLVTSTMPGEGKSWVSSNLAITFAQAGKKVALVDADMRKGRLHTMFQVENIPGLSNYLSGIDEIGASNKEGIIHYVKPTPVDNLFLITCGNVPPNPSELLASEKTLDMIDKLKDIFDIVILDGTPGLIVTDALILSRIVDSTIIVTSHKSTKKDNLAKVKKDIENVGGKIAGVVINKAPVNVAKYESSYYYGSTAISNTPRKKEPEREFYTNDSSRITKAKKEDILNQLDEFLKDK